MKVAPAYPGGDEQEDPNSHNAAPDDCAHLPSGGWGFVS
jgi:hypothetical protein